MNLQSFIQEYEEVLVGERIRFSTYLYNEQNKTACAVRCIRYVCEEFMHWNLKETQVYLDDNVISTFRLRTILNMIPFPKELDGITDYAYLLSLMYPNRIRYDENRYVISLYQRVLRGTQQFPKKYFYGSEGEKRLARCLRYAIQTFHPFLSVYDMYVFFESAQGIEFIKNARLFNAIQSLKLSPLDALHMTLSPAQRSDDFYDRVLPPEILYQRILKDENQQFPRTYFYSSNGKERFEKCLLFAFKNNTAFPAEQKAEKNWLNLFFKNCRLESGLSAMDMEPVDALYMLHSWNGPEQMQKFIPATDYYRKFCEFWQEYKNSTPDERKKVLL